MAINTFLDGVRVFNICFMLYNVFILLQVIHHGSQTLPCIYFILVETNNCNVPV